MMRRNQGETTPPATTPGSLSPLPAAGLLVTPSQAIPIARATARLATSDIGFDGVTGASIAYSYESFARQASRQKMMLSSHVAMAAAQAADRVQRGAPAAAQKGKAPGSGSTTPNSEGASPRIHPSSPPAAAGFGAAADSPLKLWDLSPDKGLPSASRSATNAASARSLFR